MYSTLEKGTFRVPILGSSGLLTASISSTKLFRVVVNNHPQGSQHGHHSWRTFVEVVAEAIFQPGDLDGAVGLGHADFFAEVANGFRGVAAPAQAGESGHARVVPAA